MHRRRVTPEQFARMQLAERHEVVRAQLSRRGLLGGAAAVLLGPGPLLLTTPAHPTTSAAATVYHRWIAFGADPTRQMAVRWQTSGPVVRPRVRIGTDATYGREVTAEPTPLLTVRPDGSRLLQHYAVARVDGLTPGTTYHYQVVHDGAGGAAVTTDDATFRTAPETAAAPFSFTAFGDQQVRSQAVAVERVLQRLQPDFHLLAGDISYADASGTGLATDTYVPERWFSYFRQVDPVARSIPWMVAVGNHDMEALYPPHGYGGFTHRFSMPANGPAGCPGVYSFVYGPVAVLSLDANDVTDEFVANRGYSGNSQLTWARQRLQALRSDPTVDFIAAVFHQCAYSTGHHGSDLGVRNAFAPLFDEFGVDVAISGHNHVYERTDPLRGGRATRPAPSGSTVNAAQDGTTYVICGAGGADLTPFDGKSDRNDLVAYRGPDVVPALLQGGTPEHVAWSRARYTGHCLVVVDVSPAVSGRPSTMTLRAVNIRGSTLDTVTFSGPRRPTSFFARNETTLLAGTAGVAAVAAGSAITLRRRRGPSPGDSPAGASPERDDHAGVGE